MKPVELVAKAVGNSSRRGDLVLDVFLGSGTTLIASEQLGRRCYGVEYEPRYADVIIRRWEALTGQSAVLENDGRAFSDVALERLPAREKAPEAGAEEGAA
jgi:DNA modification methylase